MSFRFPDVDINDVINYNVLTFNYCKILFNRCLLCMMFVVLKSKGYVNKRM